MYDSQGSNEVVVNMDLCFCRYSSVPVLYTYTLHLNHMHAWSLSSRECGYFVPGQHTCYYVDGSVYEADC